MQIADALRLFKSGKVDSLPVAEDAEEYDRLLGVLRMKEIFEKFLGV